jgi:hypothetical protein
LDGANVGVLIQNQGTLKLGASPGRVQGIDFQQDAGGSLEIELAGPGLNDFDRLVLAGQAQVAGALNVSLLDEFSPALGNSFTFLSAAVGITGAFDTINLPILAAGLSWSINIHPTFIQLMVTQATLLGDYNDDGAVDGADLLVWQRNVGNSAGKLPNDPTGVAIGTMQLNVWKENFGLTLGPPTAAVPEPATIFLMMAAGIRLRRRSIA